MKKRSENGENSEKNESGENMKRGEIVRLVLCSAVIALCATAGHIGFLPKIATDAVLVAVYLVLGWKVLLSAARNIARGKIFDEKFLMSLSTLGAIVIGETPEAAAVMLFYSVGEMIEDAAADRSRESIVRLMDLRAECATVRRGDEWLTVDPAEVAVGEEILIKPGEKIPLDAVVLSGTAFVDTHALTGESKPRSVGAGDEILSGSVCLSSPVVARVIKPHGQSTAERIIELTEHAAEVKSRGESVITRFAKVYTPIVVALSVAAAVVPSLITGDWRTWVYRGLVLLVISCPCALVVSVPITYFEGIGAASRAGLLVKGGVYLEALSKLGTVAFDKTGTLTKGTFGVTEICTVGMSEDELLSFTASAEALSPHPIAHSIVEAAKARGLKSESASEFTETSGKGVSAAVGGSIAVVGSAAFLGENGIMVSDVSIEHAGTTVHVGRDGKYVGTITLSDEIKPDARETVEKLKKNGVGLVMLTGDGEQAAAKTAQDVGIGEWESRLLPDGKVAAIEKMMRKNKENRRPLVAFVGDGINDAPVLTRADVGVAVGGITSDAAIEAADAVLMSGNLMPLVRGIKISKKTRRTVGENIAFAILVKAVLGVLGLCGIAPMWSAVFGDVGVLVLVLLNSMRVR